jgi:hypothetical protein
MYKADLITLLHLSTLLWDPVQMFNDDLQLWSPTFNFFNGANQVWIWLGLHGMASRN